MIGRKLLTCWKIRKKTEATRNLRYYDYSKTQLENEADSLNESFDKERLIRPKKIDVYDVVDFIHCTPD